MNERYPDATAEEIGSEDVCIICREGMRAWEPAAGSANPDERLRPKKLPCGHILHFACLRSWLERQQNCPTCRRPVLAAAPAAQNNTVAHANQPMIPGQPGNAPLPRPANAGEQAPAQNGNRIRFFNLGPVRLGFGAGPDLDVLERQMNQQNPAPGAVQNQANVPANLHGAANRSLFGDATRLPANTNTIPVQLHMIEQQLVHEINQLQVQQQQLYLVRALQGELARLRIAQAQQARGSVAAMAAQVQGNFVPFGAVPMANPMPVAGLPPPSLDAYAPSPTQGSMGTGHAGLPPGMTLPEGWTVLPLQRLQGGPDAVPVPRAPAQAPASFPMPGSPQFPAQRRPAPAANDPTAPPPPPPPGPSPLATAPVLNAEASVAATPTPTPTATARAEEPVDGDGQDFAGANPSQETRQLSSGMPESSRSGRASHGVDTDKAQQSAADVPLPQWGSAWDDAASSGASTSRACKGKNVVMEDDPEES
jgi:E3 ubiquitin-protein ligase synoviolin